jgi:SAM-dependent methyltransferase
VYPDRPKRGGHIVDDDFWQALPDEVEAETYRSLNPDLAHMTAGEVLAHYKTYGRGEGRTSNRLRDRNDFAALIPSGASVLEIGPFCNPFLRRPNVFYFDVLSQDELIARAKSIGLDPAGVPYIDYISPTGDLPTVNRRFDVVVSSHCIEHQPDLVGHLQDVTKLLLPGGAYFLLVPDKRYCFDHFIPESNLAEMMVAQHERRKVHTLRSVIEHRSLITHNDSLRHWQGDHGVMFESVESRLQAALQEFDDAKGRHIDVHAWYFTPDSASTILGALQDMRLSQLKVHRIYATRFGANEFWMILRA